MRGFLLLGFSLFFWVSTAQVKIATSAVSKDTSVSIFEYLIRNEVVEISMKTDMKNLRKNTFNEVYQQAELSFFLNDALKMNFNIEVRTRGNMRKRNCTYPSLKLNFNKTELRSNGLNSTDKYKLVCQCSSGKYAEQLLFKEYLAYKLYNIVSEYSFRVHLFKISYVDSRTNKAQNRYAFLIESEKELAKRMDATELEPDSVNLKLVERENILRLGMFQYMIGNTDYNLTHMHNLSGFRLKKSKMPVVVAYDFDYAGLVDAKYAIPNPEMPIRDVKERWFNIKGANRNEIDKQVTYFLQHKTEILDYCRNFTILKKSSYHSSQRYILEFFSIIEDPLAVNKNFIHK